LPPEVTVRVLDIRRRTFPSPDAGARLPQLLATAGFTEVRALQLRLSGCHAEARRGLRLDTYAVEAARLGALDRAAAAGELDIRVSLHLAAGARR
jgi:hypothetical protein